MGLEKPSKGGCLFINRREIKQLYEPGWEVNNEKDSSIFVNQPAAGNPASGACVGYVAHACGGMG